MLETCVRRPHGNYQCLLGSVQQKAVVQSKQGAIQDKFSYCKMKTLTLSKFSLPSDCQMHYRHARLNINPCKTSLLKLQREKCLCTCCSWELWQNFLLLYFSHLLSFAAESCTVTNYSNLKSELCCNMFFSSLDLWRSESYTHS